MNTVLTRSQFVDNRIAYLGFALAYVLGHGMAAARGAEILDLPGWLPLVALYGGLALGTVAATVAALRAQKHLPPQELGPAKLLGMVWVVGLAGLFLLVTGLGRTVMNDEIQPLLWPVGSAFVVGLIYLAEGAMRRDTIHYALGGGLVLLGGVALLLPTVWALTLLAVVGGGGYLVATALTSGRMARA